MKSSRAPIVGVITDDLTGANATAALLWRRGLRTAALPTLKWPAACLAAYRCVCINTESRLLPVDAARRRVRQAADLIMEHGGRVLGKRIDSTLRGHIGAELEGALEAVGQRMVAVVTAAFPASGRTMMDGHLLVHGVPVTETFAWNDPISPVRESHLPTLLAAQTSLPVGHIPLAVVQRGAAAVAEAIREEVARGTVLLCADAVMDHDVIALGHGMSVSGVPCLAADPGPLTAAYAGALGQQKALVVSGSISPVTVEQLDRLETEAGAALVRVDLNALVAQLGEVERVVAALIAAGNGAKVIGIRVDSPVGDGAAKVPDPGAAPAILRGLAEITARALERIPDVSGLYLTGGDTAQAVCSRIEATALDIEVEVMPLAVAGRILGGPCHDLTVVTKGGLVGAADAALTCVRHILGEVQRN